MFSCKLSLYDFMMLEIKAIVLKARYFGLILTVFISCGICCATPRLDTWRKVIIDTARNQALPPNLTVRNLAMLCIGSFECLNIEEGKYSSF